MRAARRSPRLPTEVAAAAHGLLSLADLRRHGMGRVAIEHAVSGGELLRVTRGLFAVAGSPDSEGRRALAATRSLRGALSHRSAAAWWDLPAFDLEPLHVMRLRPGSSDHSPLGVLHRPTRLLPHHVTQWRCVPVTTPARTLFDLAGSVHPGLVARTYDTMWSRGLVTPTLMDRTLEELRGRGRPGVQLMRRLIEERRGLVQPTGSRLERRFETLNDRADIPRLRRQIDLGDDDGWIGRMDFVGEERALVVEVDSELHHAALLDTRRDESRTQRLEAAGWHVLRVREDELWHRSTQVVDRLERAWRNAPPR